MYTRPTFAKRKAFGIAIRKTIAEYFAQSGIEKTGDWRLWHKTIVLFILLASTYLVILFTDIHLVWKIPTWIFLGMITACIGFNVMHDAVHDAYSKNKTASYIFGLSLNFLGANSFFWRKKHNEQHHSFTNLDGHDDDVNAPGMRLHLLQKWHWYHRLQFFYWPIMYSLLYFGWIYFTDFKKYFTKKVGDRPFSIPLKEHFVFWISKAVYITIFVFIPWNVLGWQDFLIGYAVMLATCGLFIAVVFQLAHIVEKADQPTVDSVTEVEWVAHQVETTANFATQNRVFGWLFGGLNFQVEHHIDAKISHIHYRKLSPRIKAVCNQFDMPYNEYPTFFEGIRSHVKALIELGRKPAVAI